mgnify:CR=1 FL=1
MIVKKEEWDKLQKSKEEIESHYEEKIKNLNSQISELNIKVKELEKERSFDNIEINIYKREVDSSGYWKDYYNVQLEKTNIDLSQGIRGQILRIFRKSLDFFYKEYQEKLKQKEDRISTLNSQKLLLLSSIEKLPYFTKRKRIIEIYNNTIGTL